MNLHFILLISIFIKTIEVAKVLFLCPIPTRSHQKIYSQIWTEMSLRGHDIHVLTPNPLFNSTLTNLTEYDLSELYQLKSKKIKKNLSAMLLKSNFYTMFLRYLVFQDFVLHNITHFVMNSPAYKQLSYTQESFDACIVEWMFPIVAAYSHVFKCHLIGISSTGVEVNMLDAIGNPSHPIVAPDQDLPVAKYVSSFYEKLWSAIWVVFIRIHTSLVLLPESDKVSKKLFGTDTPYIGDLFKNVSLLILNQNSVFQRPVPTLPNVIKIGGFKQQPMFEKKMDKYVKDILDNASNGVIYMSFGTTMPAYFLPDDKQEIIKKVFRSLPFTVLWKWENLTMIQKPENVYISEWFPQTEVLEHPNVKVFITQGGQQSIEEAIAANKPIIGIPGHSDQLTNVDACVTYGMGKMLDLNDLTEQKLRSYIIEIINNPTYAQNAKNLNNLMKDQPQDGLDKAIWWIEYVIRHNGAKHFKSPAADLPWWEYLLFDVLAFIIGVFFLTLIIVKYVIIVVFALIYKRNRDKKEKQKLL